MDRSAMETLVRRLYDARVAGDVDKILGFFAPQHQFRLAGDQTMGVAAIASGRTEFVSMLGMLVQAWEWREVRIDNLLIDGDRAAVRHRTKMRFVPTGDLIETEICDVITFRDGKIVDFVEFCDTARALQLVQAAAAKPA